MRNCSVPDQSRGLALFLIFALTAATAGEFVADEPITCFDCDEWNQALEPFHIFGNTYYVGTAGLTSLLIVTDDGLIVLDGGLPQSAALLAANIETLGFSIEDVRMITLSHAHYDHAGGIAALQRASGAGVFASRDAATALAAGGPQENDPQFVAGDTGMLFPAVRDPVAVDDGAILELGGTAVQGVSTPGHTAGGMSWTWQACEERRCLDVVYADSVTAVSRPGYRYSDGMADMLRGSIERLAKLDCDVLFATHAYSFHLHEKLRQGRDAFIDDQSCVRYAARAAAALDQRLAGEKQGSSAAVSTSPD